MGILSRIICPFISLFFVDAIDSFPHSQDLKLVTINAPLLQEQYDKSDFILKFFTAELKHPISSQKTLSDIQQDYIDILTHPRYSVIANFLVCEQTVKTIEISNLYNPDTIKEETLMATQNGVVTHKGQSVSTQTEGTYAIDPQGQICIWIPEIHSSQITYVCHSYFFKSNGVGMAIACGGHIKLTDGKITEIDCKSGHYQPALLQLAYVVLYLNNLNVVSPSIQIHDYNHQYSFTLQEILKLTEIFNIKT